ncbi:hypothetical protein J4401_06480 [Candidatus Woesearchaeota archaeon]|nr:hypothetical protein [Candidatus Woesearchaeota archaeon]
MTNERPFVIVGVFWAALLLFLLSAYSVGTGVNLVTGYAAMDGWERSYSNMQSIAIIMLVFTNLVTIFFLAKKTYSR